MKRLKLPQLTDRHKELLSYVLDHKNKLILAIVCSGVVAAMTAASAALVKPVVEDIFQSKDLQMLVVIPLVVVVVFLVKGLAAYGAYFLLNLIGQDILRQYRNRLYNHMQDLPLAFFQRRKTGDLMSRITSDVGVISSMFTSAITGAVKEFLSVIGLLIVTFYMIPKLAAYTFVILPLAAFPIFHFGQKVRRTRMGAQKAIGDLNAFLQEALVAIKIVKAFNMQEYEKKRFAAKSREIFRKEMKETKVQAMSTPFMEFLGGIGIAFVIWYGGKHVIAGTYSFGAFMAFLTAVGLMYQPLRKISKTNNSIQRGLAAVERIYEILEQKSGIIEAASPVDIQPGSHCISFNNVSFKYDTTMVLQNIDLTVKSGEIVALVGMSGGGKTSLVNLIPRFYDVSEGAVLIDDIDIRDTSLLSLRQRIALVTQEPILFNDTVRHNIAYGRRNASEEEIIEASRAAYAYDFIEGFPAGFDTTIGELGGRLSGGQKQRICIARALLKDSPILILDEATSSLDSESETLVQKALGNLMQGRTTFIIAHRLSTIGYAHRILVIADGRIVEEGLHQELLERRGAYYKLYQMQYGDNQLPNSRNMEGGDGG